MMPFDPDIRHGVNSENGASHSEGEGPEAIRRLRVRTQRMAQPPERKIASHEQFEVVEFLLGAEHYCLESRYVREAVAVRSLTPLPGVPPFVAGITNLRGEIVPVISLRALLDMVEQPTTRSYIIHLTLGQAAFGLLADTVLGMRFLRHTEVLPPPATMTGQRVRYLKGMTPGGLAVMDAHALLTDERLIVRDA